MQKGFEEAVSYITHEHGKFRKLIESLDENAISATPSSGGWSAIQLVEHLTLAEKMIGDALARFIAAARANGSTGEVAIKPLADHLARFTQNPVPERFEAPEQLRPTGTISVADAFDAYDKQRSEVLATIDAADGLALDDVTFPHPYFGMLNVTEWVLFLGLHERRHREQILRNLELKSAAG